MALSKPTTKKPNDDGREEQIRTRAYELYEARGREEGHDLEDWLEAEADYAAVTSAVA